MLPSPPTGLHVRKALLLSSATGTRPVKYVGVDLAAKPKGTSICIVDWGANAQVEALHKPADDERIIRTASGDVAAMGIDCPFGWPKAFVSFVQQGQSCRRGTALTADETDRLKYRATDRWLREKQLGATSNRLVRPLSVSTDKLGAVALRCVHLIKFLEQNRQNRRESRPAIYEVYPAASLACWMTLDGSYKKNRNRQKDAAAMGVRRQIIERLADSGLDLGSFREAFVASDDNLDALVSALTAGLASAGRTDPPPENLAHLAASEGWINVPSGSLPNFFEPLPRPSSP